MDGGGGGCGKEDGGGEGAGRKKMGGGVGEWSKKKKTKMSLQF